ncbi:hypothetical protein GCM10020220_042550 [Nonomuraea rubra]
MASHPADTLPVSSVSAGRWATSRSALTRSLEVPTGRPFAPNQVITALPRTWRALVQDARAVARTLPHPERRNVAVPSGEVHPVSSRCPRAWTGRGVSPTLGSNTSGRAAGVATAQLSAAGAGAPPALKDPAVAVNAMIQPRFMEPPLHVFL